MKIWYIITFSKGNHHEIYNASILKLCTLCSDEVVAISDKRLLPIIVSWLIFRIQGIHKHRYLLLLGKEKIIFIAFIHMECYFKYCYIIYF